MLRPHVRVDALLTLAAAVAFTGLVFALVAALDPDPAPAPARPGSVVTGAPAGPTVDPPAPSSSARPVGVDKHGHSHEGR